MDLYACVCLFIYAFMRTCIKNADIRSVTLNYIMSSSSRVVRSRRAVASEFDHGFYVLYY